MTGVTHERHGVDNGKVSLEATTVNPARASMANVWPAVRRPHGGGIRSRATAGLVTRVCMCPPGDQHRQHSGAGPQPVRVGATDRLVGHRDLADRQDRAWRASGVQEAAVAGQGSIIVGDAGAVVGGGGGAVLAVGGFVVVVIVDGGPVVVASAASWWGSSGGEVMSRCPFLWCRGRWSPAVVPCRAAGRRR